MDRKKAEQEQRAISYLRLTAAESLTTAQRYGVTWAGYEAALCLAERLENEADERDKVLRSTNP